MFLATSTDLGQMGGVTSSLLTDLKPLLFIILGLVIGFWILEIIVGLVRGKKDSA